MNKLTNVNRTLIVTVALRGLVFICLNPAAQAGTQPYTITYDIPGLDDLDPIPEPYPGIITADVIHWASDQNGVPFRDVFFSAGVGPGNGYGDLVSVAVGPYERPSNFNLTDPAWGVISITPKYPGTFGRLVSFDIASFDDNNVDEVVPGIFVHA